MVLCKITSIPKNFPRAFYALKSISRVIPMKFSVKFFRNIYKKISSNSKTTYYLDLEISIQVFDDISKIWEHFYKLFSTRFWRHNLEENNNLQKIKLVGNFYQIHKWEFLVKSMIDSLFFEKVKPDSQFPGLFKREFSIVKVGIFWNFLHH